MNYNYKVNTRKIELESCSDSIAALQRMILGLDTFLSSYDRASEKVVFPVDVISPDQVLSLVSIRDELEKMHDKLNADLKELGKDV